MSFTQLPDHELDQRSDEGLIAYLRAATGAGELSAARRALAILVYGHRQNVERRMALRLPRSDVGEAAADAIVRALAAAFDGSSEGEFRSWLGTIVDRTVADWYRRRERRVQETQLPSEHLGEEGVWHAEPGVASEAGAVELRIVVDAVMSQLNDAHRQVVELHVFDGLPASEVCARVDGMTPDNVAQVASRFRKSLLDALKAGSEDRVT